MKILGFFFTWILGILLALGIRAVLAFPVMLLWNGLMPSLFALPELSFLQCCGIMVLTMFLFPSTSIKEKNK